VRSVSLARSVIALRCEKCGQMRVEALPALGKPKPRQHLRLVVNS
jgi:hypothetical protein